MIGRDDTGPAGNANGFEQRPTMHRASQVFLLEKRMHDVQAILDAVGSERATLFGIAEGGPMYLLSAQRNGQRNFQLHPQVEK